MKIDSKQMVGCDGRPVCQLVVSAGVARADKDVGRNAGQGLSSPGLGWERPLEKMELRADGGEEETCVYNCSRRVSTGGEEKGGGRGRGKEREGGKEKEKKKKKKNPALQVCLEASRKK